MASLSVGVALCTYNGARYVRAQLDSITQQTRLPAHVMIADDGSTDATLDIVRQWARAAAGVGIRVTILDTPGPGGVTANFARALAAVDADLIALCDHDDVWLPDRLEVAAQAFDDEAILLHHSNARLVESDGVTEIGQLSEVLKFPIEWPNPPHGAFGALLRRNLVTGAATMVRRSLLATAAPFPSDWVHDEWLAILAAAQGGIAYTPEPLIRYRQHGANQIGVSSLGLSGKFRRMVEPRGDRNATLARRAAALVERLEATETPQDYLAVAQQKARFEARRAAWPAGRAVRLPRVLREAARGTYPRLSSQGWLDVVRDALQPAR